MNFYIYFISRIFVFAFILVFVLLIEGAGLKFSERRLLPDYERLGLQVSDPHTSHVEWVPYPPQAMLVGRYQGHTFRYWRVHRVYTHLYLHCRPQRSFELSRHHPQIKAPLGEPARLLPGWESFNSFATHVPLLKRSMDRRPFGFTADPGVDVYRQTTQAFDATTLSQDLSTLLEYCGG